MAAKKSAAKTGKAKKAVKPASPPAKPASAAARPAPKKTAVAKKVPAKVVAPPARPTPSVKAAVPPKTNPSARSPEPLERIIKTVTATTDTSRKQPAAPAASRPVAAPDHGDDNETSESLLAGPRNVKPYVPKRGEQYMSKEQLDHFRTILQSWKQDLMVEVDRTVSHMKDEAANFPDPNDRATQEEEFSLELRTRDRERKLIRKIDEALARIEDGSYGYCLETGEQIGVKRLEARPVATLSLEAQERRERREKQYGDRDDRYR
jgi:DnaK suppressor protein